MGGHHVLLSPSAQPSRKEPKWGMRKRKVGVVQDLESNRPGLSSLSITF